MEMQLVERDKRRKQVKSDKEPVQENVRAPPFKLQKSVNKPPADCWPQINTLALELNF